MPDFVKDSNATWTKYVLLLLASIAATGVALLACVICMISLAERKEPAIEDAPGPEIVANTPSRSKDGSPEDAPPLPSKDADGKKRSSYPGVIQPLDEAVFLGTQAKGRRFCIIADASLSMKGAPFTQVKKEIIHTLGGLQPSSQFYIIFFNKTDVPMPYPTWLDASEENITKVKPWIQNMPTVLYTWPTSSFDRAFKLQPKPDVIFFMTDGLIPAKEKTASHIASLNAQEPKTIIHTILFQGLAKGKTNDAKAGAAAAQLRTIAEKNGGTFRRVNQK